MSGPFKNCRDDWQLPGPSGPRTKKRAKAMRKPPFERKQTEQELKGGKLPKVLKRAVDKFADRISDNTRGELAVDKDSGFCTSTGLAWDILLAPGWRTNDGGHRTIIEPNSAVAAELIRTAEPCDCDDCIREQARR